MSDSKIKIYPKHLENLKDKNEDVKIYIDEEINGLSYNLAIQYDKRNYFQYYTSLLKTQHSLISALFNNNDYNSGIIKLDFIMMIQCIKFMKVKVILI